MREKRRAVTRWPPLLPQILSKENVISKEAQPILFPLHSPLPLHNSHISHEEAVPALECPHQLAPSPYVAFSFSG